MIGIYKITCVTTSKIYIGSSKNINKRLSAHKNLLRNNKHHSIHLQRAYNKYGKESFVYNIVEECNIDFLLNREQYYLNVLLKADEYLQGTSDFFIKNSYNICPLSIKGFSGKHSRLSILKQIISRKLAKIYKVDIRGNVLSVYDMVNETDDNVSCVYLSIKKQQCLRDKDYGYIKEDIYFNGYIPKKTVVWNKNIKSPTNKGTSVYVYDIYGRFYNSFDTIKLTANHFNIESANICRKMNKYNMKLIGNSNIIYYNFFTSEQNYNNLISVSNVGNVSVYTIFDEFVGYSSVEELSSILNVQKFAIISVLKNIRNQCKNYKFLYRNDIV